MATSTAPHDKQTVITRRMGLHPAQKAFLESKSLFKALVAGISSGKSIIGAYDMIRRAKPGRLYMVIAPTYTLLSDATFRSFLKVADEFLGLIGLTENNDVKRGAPPSIKLATGAEILFRSGDRPDSLRGPNLSGIWLDEASLMDEDVYKIAIGRLREGGEQGWLTSTFTPKGKKHWTYKTFALGKENTELFRAKTKDNPFNPAGFDSIIRSQYTSFEAQQELEGLFLDEGGGHFLPRQWPRHTFIGDAWTVGARPARQVILHRDLYILAAADWAMKEKKENDCTAIIVAAIPPMGLTLDNCVFILDCVNRRMRPEERAPELNRICEQWKPQVVSTDDDILSLSMLLECRRQKSIPEIRCLPIRGQNKLKRCQTAIIHGENHRIYLPENAPWLDDFCDQLAAFTGMQPDEEDDMVDSLGIICRLVELMRGAAGQGVNDNDAPAMLLDVRGGSQPQWIMHEHF